jgi:hypothetical protein
MNGNDVEIKMLRITVIQPVMARTPGLLPMLYKLHELAEDLGVPYRTLWEWLKFGLLHQTDARGHIWINGEDFKQGVTSNRKKPRVRLAAREARCMSCGPVKLLDPERIPAQGKLYYQRGKCPNCGSDVSRGGRYDQ